MWKGRFAQDTDERVARFTQSLDLDWRMVQDDIRGSIAHARMLARVGILSTSEAETIERGLMQIARECESGEYQPSEALEDVHMNVEARLTEITGDAGAKLHTGRSRNDQTATTVRLAMKREIIEIWHGLSELLDALAAKAEEHAEIIVPGYTHLQQAQPVSMGHFWMAHRTALARDARRLAAALASADLCPLGSGALAGSTLPLDREMTASELGFAGICPNSMDAIASRDHMSDLLYFSAMFGVHVSRLAEDLIIYFTSEFGWLKLPDAFCTGSSMMPQKKNPDVLELIRGRAGALTGALVDSLMSQKGTPMTYDRDFQEDKRGLWASCDSVRSILEVLPPLIANVEVDAERARRGFADGCIFATDVAEHLVSRGIPFRRAHEIVGRAVKDCIDASRPLTDMTEEEWSAASGTDCSGLPELLTPERSAARRDTAGGASPASVRRQLAAADAEMKELRSIFSKRC